MPCCLLPTQIQFFYLGGMELIPWEEKAFGFSFLLQIYYKNGFFRLKIHGQECCLVYP
ncbi:hypothetical protein Nmel_015400 [Mimus melanotis]